MPRMFAIRTDTLALRLWPLAASLLILAVLAGALFSNRYGRTAVTASFFLPDMFLPLPVRPVTWLTDDPLREEVTVTYGGGKTMPADLYRPPGDGPFGAIVFVMGAPPLDLDDPRLEKLAEDAARTGIVMLIPFSPDLDRELILKEEPDAYVQGYRLLESLPYVDTSRIGFIGVSVGGSLALIAAADPAIAPRVDFVIPFGAYYDVLDMLAEVTTRSTLYDGRRDEWIPRQHTVKVLSRQIISRLPDAQDRTVLDDIFVRQKEATAVDLSRLSPDGRAAYDFLSNRDPARVDALLAGLPQGLVDEIALLSPSRVTDSLEAELFIIHDRGDEFVPHVESRRLRDALAGRADVHFTEVSIFEHVEPDAAAGTVTLFLDGSRLYFRLYQLLLRLS